MSIPPDTDAVDLKWANFAEAWKKRPRVEEATDKERALRWWNAGSAAANLLRAPAVDAEGKCPTCGGPVFTAADIAQARKKSASWDEHFNGEAKPSEAEAVREACAEVADRLRKHTNKSVAYAAGALADEIRSMPLPPAPARGEEDDLDPKVIDEIRSRAAVAMKGKTFKSAERIEDALTAVPRTAQGTDEEDLARRAKMHLQYFGVDDHIGMVEMLVGFAEQERKNATSLSPQAGVSEISSAPTNRKILLWWKAAGWGLGFYQDDEEGRGWRCVDDRVIPKNQSDCRFWAELPASPRPASSEAAG